MRTLKKTVVLLLLTATALAGGCGGAYPESYRRTQDLFVDFAAQEEKEKGFGPRSE